MRKGRKGVQGGKKGGLPPKWLAVSACAEI